MLLTCFDMVAFARWRAQAATGIPIAGALQRALGILLAAAAILLATLCFILSVIPPLGVPARIGFAALSIFLVALLLWLREQSGR